MEVPTQHETRGMAAVMRIREIVAMVFVFAVLIYVIAEWMQDLLNR